MKLLSLTAFIIANTSLCQCTIITGFEKDQRITLLKRELGYTPDFEFHFSHNSKRQREAFLKAVSPYDFFYAGVCLNKDPERLWGEGFRHKDSLYKYASRLVFENIKPYLDDAIVLIDESGRREFRSQLAKYLRTRVAIDHGKVKKIRMQSSHSSNLLQLADYVSSVINRTVQNKLDADDYRKYIASKEIVVQVWPK